MRHRRLLSGLTLAALLAQPALAAGAALAPVGAPGNASSPSAPGPRRPTWPAAIAFSIGGTALVFGGLFGLSAIASANEARLSCKGTRCTPAAADPIRRSKAAGDASTAAFVIAAADIAAGIALLLFLPGKQKSAPRAAEAKVTPFIGLGQVGLSGVFY